MSGKEVLRITVVDIEELRISRDVHVIYCLFYWEGQKFKTSPIHLNDSSSAEVREYFEIPFKKEQLGGLFRLGILSCAENRQQQPRDEDILGICRFNISHHFQSLDHEAAVQLTPNIVGKRDQVVGRFTLMLQTFSEGGRG